MTILKGIPLCFLKGEIPDVLNPYHCFILSASVCSNPRSSWVTYVILSNFYNFSQLVNTHLLLFYQLLSSHQTFIILSNFCHRLAPCYLFTFYVIFSSCKFTYCTHHKHNSLFLSYRAHVLCANIPFLLTRRIWPSCHFDLGDWDMAAGVSRRTTCYLKSLYNAQELIRMS